MKVFSKGFGKEYQWDWWKYTWEVWKNTIGTGGNVPGRYGVKLEMCFGHTELTVNENWSPLPISLQIKLVFKKGFPTKI
jgi:hypothetical protein